MRTAAGSITLRGLVHVAEGDVARLEHSAAVRAVMRSLGWWTITPPSTPRTTVISPSASRMRSASRSDGRETPKRSTRSGSRPSDSPSVSSPLTIRARSSSAICSGFSRDRGFFAVATTPPCSAKLPRRPWPPRRNVITFARAARPWYDERGEAMDIGFRAVDADNHYYETVDACTRHLDKEFRQRGVQTVQQGTPHAAARGRQAVQVHPEPDVRPDHRGRLHGPHVPRPGARGCRPAHAHEGRAAAAGVPGPRRAARGDGRSGPRRRC